MIEDFILSALEAIVYACSGLPSRKTKLINRRLKILLKEDWFDDFCLKFNNKFFYPISEERSFKELIYQSDIESIWRDEAKKEEFKRKLYELLGDEKHRK